MLHQLRSTPEIYFGDKESIAAPEARELGAVINVAHSIKAPYWANLGRLPGRIWTFRVALKDADEFTPMQADILTSILRCCDMADKLPVLCHCRMGGHRGPSTAIFAAWFLRGMRMAALSQSIRDVQEHRPGFMRFNSRRVYRNTMLKHCLDHSSGIHEFPALAAVIEEMNK